MLVFKGPGWYSIFFDSTRNIQAWFWANREEAASMSSGEIYEIKNTTDFWEAVIFEIQKEFQIS